MALSNANQTIMTQHESLHMHALNQDIPAASLAAISLSKSTLLAGLRPLRFSSFAKRDSKSLPDSKEEGCFLAVTLHPERIHMGGVV
jgi:hypothetical protein